MKERILHVIAKEWQDNLLKPRQKVAKFYHDKISMEWIENIPSFDVIIMLADNSLDNLNIQEGDKNKMLGLLLEKAKSQLFIKVASSPVDNEICKDDLLNASKGYNIKQITEEDEDGFQIYAVERQDNIEAFIAPSPANISRSYSTIIEVDISICTDMYGASYIEDFQHFVEVLKEHEANHDLEYNHSILNKYYSKFQPTNTGQALFSTKEEVPFLRQGFIGYPWHWNKDIKLAFSNKRGKLGQVEIIILDLIQMNLVRMN